jgi:hypothetical protein
VFVGDTATPMTPAIPHWIASRRFMFLLTSAHPAQMVRFGDLKLAASPVADPYKYNHITIIFQDDWAP